MLGPPGSRASATLLVAILSLTLLAAGLVVNDGVRSRGAETPASEFQRLVRGLGLGGETNLSRCTMGFDARLESICAEHCGRIPGGEAFCVAHSFSVLHLAGPRVAPATWEAPGAADTD